MCALDRMTLGEACGPLPACLGQDATLGLALALLARERREAVPVVDATGAVVGLLDRARLLECMDALRRSSPAGRRFDDVLATAVTSAIDPAPRRCSAGMALEDACALMMREAAPALLVVHDGQLQGLFTRDDVVRAVIGRREPPHGVEVERPGKTMAICHEVEPPPESVLAAEHARAQEQRAGSIDEVEDRRRRHARRHPHDR